METFVLICLAILAAVILFWLLAFPAALLAGMGGSIIKGVKKGLKLPLSHS